MAQAENDGALGDKLKRIHERYGSNLGAFFDDALREIYSTATKTDEPPPNCELKEISPNVFAYVLRTDEPDSDYNE